MARAVIAVLVLALPLFSISPAAAAPTLSIGNRMWFDTGSTPGHTNNGIADDDESPVVGVLVEVGLTGTEEVSGSAHTDADGFYRIDGLEPGLYSVRLPVANFGPGAVLQNYRPSRPYTWQADTNNTNQGWWDGDFGAGANPVELTAENVTGDGDPDATGAGVHGPGGDAADNLTVDFGFVPAISIGNRVWLDTGAGDHAGNGVPDDDERGVEGVDLLLIDADVSFFDDQSQVAGASSDAQGYYRFDDVTPGIYRVRLSAWNFEAGGPLAGMSSTPGSAAGFSTPENNVDHGIDRGVPAFRGVWSQVVEVGTGLAPAGDVDRGATGNGAYGPQGDASDILTVDFGFVPGFSIGNRLFYDTGTGPGETDNGRMDPGESAVSQGAQVELYTADGEIAGSMWIDSNGYYRFDAVPPGEYRVHVPASNFAFSWFQGMVSSTGESPTSDSESNNRDHGLDHPDPAVNGISAYVTVGGDMPLLDGEPGPQLTGGFGGHGITGDAADNLVVDFGFVRSPPIAPSSPSSDAALPPETTGTTASIEPITSGLTSALSAADAPPADPRSTGTTSASGAGILAATGITGGRLVWVAGVALVIGAGLLMTARRRGSRPKRSS